MDRPEGDVKVLVDGHWHDGEVLSWSTPSGWWANVRWRHGHETELGTFPEAEVRDPD